MKKYHVEYGGGVQKRLEKIDAPTRERIKKWIMENLEGCENPRARGTNLHGDLKNYWRYRVGNYRIIAEIVDERVIIIVVKIDKRGEVYS